MSSEVYIRWEVENLQELHKQLKLQLEKERQHQAKLFGDVTSEINKIKNEISVTKSSTEEHRGKHSVAIEQLNNYIECESKEKVITGFSDQIEQINFENRNLDKRKLEEIDLSKYLIVNEKITEQEEKQNLAKEINIQLSTAIINNDSEIQDLNNFVAYVNGLLLDKELGYEYFYQLVINRFEELKKKIVLMNFQDISEDTIEYFSICSLLGIKPKIIKGEELRKEITNLFKLYVERQKDDFVYKNLLEVFSELGMVIVDEMELDGLIGKKVIDETIPDCAIFMSMDGEGVVFETVAEVDYKETISMNKRNEIQNNVQTVCKKHQEVIRRMQERGIHMKIECEEVANFEQVRKIEKNTKKKRMKAKMKEKTLGSN